MTEEYEFQVVYKGYVEAESADHAHGKVSRLLNLAKPCLADVVIHRLDPVERAQKRSTELMCAASAGVERQAREDGLALPAEVTPEP